MFDSIIDGYSRADALTDGDLVAVPAELAADARFRYPVALTRAVWEGCVAWTDEDAERTGAIQDETGRLMDVLTMAMRGVRAARNTNRNRSTFPLHRVPRNVTSEEIASDGYEPPMVRLVVVCGPGDNGEPVITIQEPGDD